MVSVILLAIDKLLIFYPNDLVLNFSRISSYVSLLTLLWIGITPKYFPRSSISGIPATLQSVATSFLSILAEKNSFDLVKLIFLTWSLWNLREDETTSIYSIEASANKSKSSAKNRCSIAWPPNEALIGFHLPSTTSLWTRCANLSMLRTSKDGEMGSPCRIPHVGLTGSMSSPFHISQNGLLVAYSVITLTILGGSPISLRVSLTMSHSMRSYAFSRMILKIIVTFLLRVPHSEN